MGSSPVLRGSIAVTIAGTTKYRGRRRFSWPETALAARSSAAAIVKSAIALPHCGLVSGDKILSIGGSAPEETLSAFVDVYLRRHPNSLEPDFDLPYLPRME